MASKKLPLWLVWDNPDIMADIGDCQYFIMFKNGDGESFLFMSSSSGNLSVVSSWLIKPTIDCVVIGGFKP